MLRRMPHAKCKKTGWAVAGRTWDRAQYLLQAGKDSRNGFMENVHRHHTVNETFIKLHGAKPDHAVVEVRNIAVHESNFLTDMTLYAAGVRPQKQRNNEILNIYGITLEPCRMPRDFTSKAFINMANLHGTMYKCKAWTPYSHDVKEKKREIDFKTKFAECLDIWNKSKVSNPATFAKDFDLNATIKDHISAMQAHKEWFGKEERELHGISSSTRHSDSDPD